MGQTANPKIKRALVSVSNKEGIVELCSVLTNEHQVEIISTGGTLKSLLDRGVKAIDISEFILATIDHKKILNEEKMNTIFKMIDSERS